MPKILVSSTQRCHEHHLCKVDYDYIPAFLNDVLLSIEVNVRN